MFETGHLWFLVCLLGFSLVLLPGFAWLRRPTGARLLERLGGLLARPGGLLLPALPLAVVEVTLGSDTGHGGWNHASYALSLVYGFLAAADPRTGEALQRHWRPAAALGLLLFLAAGAAAYGAADAGAEPFTDMDPPQHGVPAAQERRRLAVGGGHPGPGEYPHRAPPELAGATRSPPRGPGESGAAWGPTPTRPCCRSTCCTRRSSWSSPTSCWPGRSAAAPSTA